MLPHVGLLSHLRQGSPSQRAAGFLGKSRTPEPTGPILRANQQREQGNGPLKHRKAVLWGKARSASDDDGSCVRAASASLRASCGRAAAASSADWLKSPEWLPTPLHRYSTEGP